MNERIIYTPEHVSQLVKGWMSVHDPRINAAVFNTLRILKAKNPGDTYLEAYLNHYHKREGEFFDYYHLLWSVGSLLEPRNVIEIGCRTGISICQLLSSMMDPSAPEVFLFDIFADGFTSPAVVKMNLKALNIPQDKVHFIIGDSAKTIPEFMDIRFKKADYILVDGNHDKQAARVDLDNVVSLLAPSGLLFFDDIAPDGCDLIDVWEQFKASHPNEFFFHENMNGKGIGVGVKR
jgi:predicted O-methyltransferase YrrM